MPYALSKNHSNSCDHLISAIPSFLFHKRTIIRNCLWRRLARSWSIFSNLSDSIFLTVYCESCFSYFYHCSKAKGRTVPSNFHFRVDDRLTFNWLLCIRIFYSSLVLVSVTLSVKYLLFLVLCYHWSKGKLNHTLN